MWQQLFLKTPPFVQHSPKLAVFNKGKSLEGARMIINPFDSSSNAACAAKARMRRRARQRQWNVWQGNGKKTFQVSSPKERSGKGQNVGRRMFGQIIWLTTLTTGPLLCCSASSSHSSAQHSAALPLSVFQIFIRLWFVLQDLGDSPKLLLLEISLVSFARRSGVHRLSDLGLRDAGDGRQTQYRGHSGR